VKERRDERRKKKEEKNSPLIYRVFSRVVQK